jgi:hypothetical protein
MASRLNPSVLALIASLWVSLAPHALAQALPDPTRPPGNVEAVGSAYSTSGLQSIIRPVGEKPRALIHGEVVALGGKVGGVDGAQRLVAINTDSVVLQDASGNRETLTLTPGISKTPAKNKPSVTR